MVALEDAFQTRIDEGAFAGARDVSQLADARRTSRPRATRRRPSRSSFPSWNRSWPARAVRRASLPTWILPLARVFAWITRRGPRAPRAASTAPVIFAANHQSHMDTPVILAALPPRLRYRVAPAMAKEFFKAHFFPDAVRPPGVVHQQPELLPGGALLQRVSAAAARGRRAPDAALHRRGARGRLLGADLSRRAGAPTTGEIDRFPAGHRHDCVAAGRAGRAVRIDGLDKVLHHTWKMARPGRVRVAFGAPLDARRARTTKRSRSRSKTRSGRCKPGRAGRERRERLRLH